MTEFELKFEIPPACLKGVATAMLEGRAGRQRLQARYFDTADDALAMQGIVVRLRKEGRRWVQTAKGPTADLLERLEHNVPLVSQPAATVPVVDLLLHRGTAVGKAIERALGIDDEIFPDLILKYSTDVQRFTRLTSCLGSTVEVSLDQGRVFLDGHSQSICELEVELKKGVPAHAVVLAREWCSKHGLWLSSISKSMKGQRLRSAEPFGAALTAVAPKYAHRASGEEITTAVVQSCLNQILVNASEVAGSSYQADHVHQLRVGIRRLRTALRELGCLTTGIDPAWEAVLVDVFRSLGRYRDHSHLALFLQPQLLEAGGPVVCFTEVDGGIDDPGATVRDSNFQDVLLGLIGFLQREVHGKAHNKAATSQTLKKTLSLRLEKLHTGALRDGKKFLVLDEVQQHRVRKRLKRLRYLMEFAAPLFSARKVHQMTVALKPAQDAMGLYNDELMALLAWRALANSNPDAWFGVGWFAARRLPNARRCLKDIKSFADLKPFWRK